jgi:hypothetical protein
LACPATTAAESSASSDIDHPSVVRFGAVPASRSSALRSSLPACDIAEMRLAEYVAAGGCPLCAARAQAEERLTDALLGEAVNDVGVRARLDRAGGFCARHTRLLPERERALRGGTTGSAILFGAIAEARAAQLRELAAASGRGLSRRAADARRAPDCPLCADVAAAGRAAIVTLGGRLADPAWAVALADASFCLADLFVLWEVVARSDRSTLEAWRPIAVAQQARVERLVVGARDAVAHSAFDRRDEVTDVDRIAADRLADLLA